MEKGVKISDVNNILYHKNVRGKEKIPISSGQNIPQVITAEELRNYIKEDIEDSGEENIIEKITFNGQEATINETTKTAEIRYTPPSEKDPTVPSHVKSITLQDINNWNLKQDNITDLDEIRNNALLGKDAYQKPSTGIPKSDLSQEVQNLLDNPSITAETDPIYSQSPAAIITYEDIGHWNSKSDFTGNYNDLYNKPTIPSAQIQSDWNQTNTNAKDYIKNKPNIPQGVVVDNALSSTSENPVQNKVINSALGSKQNTLTFDTTPTANSTNPVTSAGIKAYVDNATPTITMDDTPTSGSSNPVKSSGIYNTLQGKQNTLTFDSTPTASSSNPVTSGGVKTALDLKANQSTTYTKTEVDELFDDVAYLGDDDGTATTLDFDPQSDTVWHIQQNLSSAQKQQARENIGAADVANAVYIGSGSEQATTASFDAQADTVWHKAQTLSSAQQLQARTNIGVTDVSGTNDGTNWTSITIGSTTKAIPSGGGEANVIESITFNGTAATIDSTTKNAAISYTPPVTSVNNQTGAVSLSIPTESTVSGWGFTKNTGNVSSTDVVTIVKITQAAYDALSTKDSSTLYVITS